MRLLFASTSEIAIPSIRAVKDAGFEVVGVITKADRPGGRGQVSRPQPIVQQLKDSLAIFKVTDHDSLLRTLEEIRPDLVIAISFGMLVRSDSLKVPKYGWINLHFSLLPKYRGAAPVQRAILAGDQESGLTIFQLDEGMDTGPIFASQRLSIAGKNSGSVLSEMSEIGGELLIQVIHQISQGVAPISQKGESSLARKISSEETRILFSNRAEQIERQVRAFAPKPGAWCFFRGNRIKILASEVAHNSAGNLGEVIQTSPLTVKAEGGSLVIASIQEAGKRVMNSSEWARGSRIRVGDIFE